MATMTRKEELLQRAENYHRKIRFDFKEDGYVETVLVRCETNQYKKELEPIVPPDPYRIVPAWLTVNSYNALILNTPNMLIADIDRGDPRFNEYATFNDQRPMLQNLGSFDRFDEEHDSQMRAQSWRIYETHSGWRAICTSRTFKADWWSQSILRFLRADPRYTELCDQQKCFRARLTPKPWRYDEGCVCTLIETIGDVVLPELAEQIGLHDELTLSSSLCSVLA